MSDRAHLGLWSGVALVVANMIGAGVFTSSGYALAGLGEPHYVLWAWVVGGVLAMCGALSYAGLAAYMPQSGGEYHYLAQTVHPLAGFLAGWVSLLAGFTAPIALAALALQEYLGPVLSMDTDRQWLASVAIVLAFAMHAARRPGVILQNLAVLLKLLLLFAFVVIAGSSLELPAAPAEAAPTKPFDLGAFAVALVYISLAYSGWNATVYVASEVRDARRNATRSLWLGCAVVIVVYLALNFIFLYGAPAEAIAGQADIAAVVAAELGGAGFEHFVRMVVALALFTSISAMVMIGPRVYAKMAEDGLFPRVFRAGGEVPVAALALQAVCAIAVVWSTGLETLLGYIGFTLGLSSAVAVVGLMLLRRRLGAAAVPVWGYPVVPLVYVIGTVGAAGFLAARLEMAAFWGLATLLAGLPLYFLLRRGRQT